VADLVPQSIRSDMSVYAVPAGVVFGLECKPAGFGWSLVARLERTCQTNLAAPLPHPNPTLSGLTSFAVRRAGRCAGAGAARRGKVDGCSIQWASGGSRCLTQQQQQ
jgi:hypothetical protein